MTREPIGLAPGAELDAAGQDAKKYGTRNPVVRFLITRWLGRIRSLLRGRDYSTLADIGVGEGLALRRVLPTTTTLIGVDYRADKLAVARAEISDLRPVRADAGMLPFPDHAFDVVLCIEVLEHLLQTTGPVDELARITKEVCIVSVPWEPFFRLGNLVRGKNVSRWGNDPEHVQQFSPSRLERALGRAFSHVRIHRCFPWIVATARHESPRATGAE